MEKIYPNITSFIKFSGLDKNYESIDPNEIKKKINDREPLDIIIDDVFIRVYESTTKKSSDKDITKFVETNVIKKNKYRLIILIKKKWLKVQSVIQLQTDNIDIRLFDHSDFSHDIAPANKSNAKVISEDILDFHKIDKKNLAKISKTDILAKWMLLNEGDLIGYELYSENGSHMSARVCVV